MFKEMEPLRDKTDKKKKKKKKREQIKKMLLCIRKQFYSILFYLFEVSSFLLVGLYGGKEICLL